MFYLFILSFSAPGHLLVMFVKLLRLPFPFTLTFFQACRMAVELGLNRHVANPPANETDFQKLERRNRERTYLVLFVHDRSLSMQTGRHWMLPEDDLVRNARNWHDRGGSAIRPEDVIVAAFVMLRRIAVCYWHQSQHSQALIMNRLRQQTYSTPPKVPCLMAMLTSTTMSFFQTAMRD